MGGRAWERLREPLAKDAPPCERYGVFFVKKQKAIQNEVLFSGVDEWTQSIALLAKHVRSAA